MLDDLKYIHQRDKSDALGIVEKQADFLNYDFGAAEQLKPDHINNIVLAGMGGSAWPANVLNVWPKLKEPFEIVRGYEIPAYVDEDTLFIASSYSGNTEEALAMLEKAEQKQAQIVVIASGGELVRIAEAKSYPLFRMPSGIQPRMSTFYFIKALVQLLEPLGLTVADSKELTEVTGWLKAEIASWRPDVPIAKNLAKKVAMDIAGKTAIIYSGPLMFPAAYKWKISFTENAKNLAWMNQYPELNHNEFTGWSEQPLDKPFAVVEIRSDLEHPQVKKRFAITEKLLSGKRPYPIVVEPKGDTVLKQLLWGLAMGDFVSIYLALLNNVDPTPVDLVEKLKKEL